MTNVQKYLDLFEYKLRDEADEDSGFWCFKNPTAFDGELAKMSEIIRESDLDQDSAYTFTVEALKAMREIIEDITHTRIVPSFYDLLSDYEDLNQYSEAPVYNSELMNWISKGGNYTFVDDVVNEYGWQGKEASIIGIISLAYSTAWEEHYYKVLEAINS